MRTPQDLPRRFPRTSRRTRIWLAVGVVVLIVLIASLRGLARFWIDYLWFQSVGFTSVFRGVLLTKWLLALVFIALFFVIMLINLVITARVAPAAMDPSDTNELTLRYRDFAASHGRAVRIVTSVVFAILAGAGASREWNNWDLFRYHVTFGSTDPEFHKDIGFYIFQLPFIQFLIGWVFEALVVVLIVTVVFHYLSGGLTPQSSHRRATPAFKAHVSVLLGVLALVKAVDYYYQRLALVLSRSHVVDGATATSVHADKPARFILMVIAIVAAVLFLVNIRQRGWILPVVAVALWGLVGILLGAAYPAVYQSLRVSPSELTREAPFIQRNITATRTAYGLDKVQVQSSYTYSPTVTNSQIQGNTPQALANQQTLDNVRLLDPAVNLLNTFDKYQALRSYYSFNDLDPDRYVLTVNGKTQETATVASVRELNTSVPSGFVNQHLQYTHGYGAVVAPISQNGVKADGTPNFTLAQLPPIGQPTLDHTGSQVYFGNGSDTGSYVIGNTKTTELDYESSAGAQVTTQYAGSGGVNAGGLLRRGAFALAFGDPNFILSGQINQSSKVIYNRNVVQRAQKAAPFLKFDSSPYAVVINNSVYWVIDGYTTTNNYPYAQEAVLPAGQLPPTSGLNTSFNYVRNSVKVVISAYDGSMHLFDMGTGDPILKVYERAFPDLFTSVSQADSIIPGIQAHFRYPEDVFQVQTYMYGRYHLTNPSDFYSQAQAWAVSPDPGSGQLTSSTPIGGAVIASAGQAASTQEARLLPQYELAHLPGSTQQTFMLLTPFVPISAAASSQNLTAFMTASSDPGTYGQITVFQTPAGQTVDGPGLISNAIRSNQAISQELTFYNQQGSQVELGEVAIVPVDQSLLYVQPVYVESSTNRIPTLRDVVVVYDGIAYHSTNASLDNALCQIQNPDGSRPFSGYCGTSAAQSQLPSGGSTSTGGSTGSTTTTPGSTGSTTTAPPATTTPATVPSGSTVPSLLAQAQAHFAAADKALAAGDLGTYQSEIKQAEQAVNEAEKLQSAKP